jgi:hypothetical protein
LHLCKQEPFNQNPKEALHKNCSAVADACKKIWRVCIKCSVKELRRKMNHSSIFPTFKQAECQHVWDTVPLRKKEKCVNCAMLCKQNIQRYKTADSKITQNSAWKCFQLSKLIMFKVEIIKVSKRNLLSLTFMCLLKFYSKKIYSSSPRMWCWQWSVHYPVPTDQNARAFGTASHTVASIWFVRMPSNWPVKHLAEYTQLQMFAR